MSKKSTVPPFYSSYWTLFSPMATLKLHFLLCPCPRFPIPWTDIQFSFRFPGSILFLWGVKKKKKWKIEFEQHKDMAICSKVASSNLILFILKYPPTHTTTNFHFTYALWIIILTFRGLWMIWTSITMGSPHPKISFLMKLMCYCML